MPKHNKPSSHNQEGLPGLGARLKHARLVAGLTLRQVAEQAGCSESLVSKLEHDAAHLLSRCYIAWPSP